MTALSNGIGKYVSPVDNKKATFGCGPIKQYIVFGKAA